MTRFLLAAAALFASLGACDSADPKTDDGVVGGLQAEGGQLASASELRVKQATLGADGWLAVWHEFADSHSLAGVVFLTKGTHDDVVVPLDPPVGTLGSPGGLALRVSLHADAPADGAFTATETRLDGDDPVMLSANGQPVFGVLAVSLPDEDPVSLVIEDQTITVNPPKISVRASLAVAPAYVVITAGDTVVGSERIWDKGTRDYPVSVELPRSWTPVALVGALYAADGNTPDLTTPILDATGAPVTRNFNVVIAPDNSLDVRDQTLVSWGYKIKIANLETDELPAWVAIYEDDGGAPGALLGKATIDRSPKVALDVDLVRFVAPTETLWVALHADQAPIGSLDATDPYLLGADQAPLLVSIAVTNDSCDGLATKFCDPAEPNAISWLDRCGAPSPTTTSCGTGTCDDSGPYVKCTPLPDPCAGIAGTVCVAADPTATYFEDLCGVPVRVAARCGATSVCKPSATGATCALAASCEGNATKACDPSDPTKIIWRDRCGQPNGNSIACGGTSTCDDSGAEPTCRLAETCTGNATKACDPGDPSKIIWLDRCGQPNGNSIACGTTSTCDDSGPEPTCTVDPGCGGNTTKACNPADPANIYWLDACGEQTGATLPCGANATCDDASGEATCTFDPGCGGNSTQACSADDPDNIYWRDACGALTGATIPCGAGLTCDDSDPDDVRCIDPSPCLGAAQKFCDPADLSRVKWLDGCGRVKDATIPCGANAACSEVDGEARCVSTDVCGGNVETVCLDDDPGQVYWIDGCGELTGSTYPCGVASCDDSGPSATCTVLQTCADTKLRVCDPADDTVIRLTNACGDDLGVWSTCANGKRCSESTPGEATCACTPTDDVTCFGKHFLYQPSGIRQLDSCGYPSGPVVTECESGEICHESAAGPVCTTSLSDTSSPMYHRGCSFIDYVVYKTDLEVDCRCRRHAATIGDIDRYDDGGNMACVPQSDSWADGWTMGEGPHFRHLLHNFNGGGVYSPTHNELFATMHFTNSFYQGAGMVIGYDITTGARRIVSGRYPSPAGIDEMYGSGYESQRAVGVQRFEPTTLPGAWDLEQGSDGMLYVWGSSAGNKEITRVHPDTGARTLVWRQVLEGEATAPAGQCFSTRPKPTFAGGFQPVQLEDHAFAMGPDGTFYLGFRNDAAEGNGVVRIAADGSTCTVVSRWNGTMGQVGTGAAPQYSTVEGFGIHAGKLYASLQIGKHLLAIDLANGRRTLIANPAGSVESTPGQSTMFWDDTRDLLITAGAVQAYQAVAIDLDTGLRQALFLTAPGMPIESAPPRETGAHGAIDNGNYQGYGAIALDPVNNDHVYIVIKWGLLKYEMSTGNSYVMSQ